MQTITFRDNKLIIKDHDTGVETMVNNVSELKITCRKINTVDFKVMQHNYKRWDSDKGLVDENMNWNVLDDII